MTSTSELGYWVSPYAPSTHHTILAADAPMSAATARWMVNNTRHLVDECTQTRVNWVAVSIASSGEQEDEGFKWEGSGSSWFNVTSFVFPVSKIGPDAGETTYGIPVHLVVSIAGYTENSDELFFRAVVQPVRKRFGYDFENNECLAYFEDSTTSNTSEWIIDSTTAALYPSDTESLVKPIFFGFEEHDGNNYNVPMYFLRLTIYAKEGYASGEGHLTGVYVREMQL